MPRRLIAYHVYDAQGIPMSDTFDAENATVRALKNGGSVVPFYITHVKASSRARAHIRHLRSMED